MQYNRITFSKPALLLSILALVYYPLFEFMRWNQFDSPSYIGGARMLFGLEGGFDYQSRLTKPVALVLPGFLEWSIGLHAKWGFIFQNIILYFASGILLYKWLVIRTKSEQMALRGLWLYNTCQPLAIFSFFVLTDMPGWFFGILGIYLSEQAINSSHPNRGQLVRLGIVFGLGLLTKESAVIAPIYYTISLIVNILSFKNVVYRLLVPALFALLVLILGTGFSMWVCGDNIYLRIVDTHKVYGQISPFGLGNLSQYYRTFDMYWVLILLGAWVMWKRGQRKDVTILLSTIVFTLILFPLVYPFVVDRLMFLVAPLAVLLACFGLKKLTAFKANILLGIGGFLNISVAYAIYKWNPSGLVPIAGVAFVIVFLWIFILPEKKSIHHW